MHLDNLTSMFSLLLIFAFAALGYLVWPNQAVIHEEQKGFCAVIGPRLSPADPVSYTHLTLPTTPYV